MALPEDPLSIVEHWKKKSYEMSSQSNDSIISLISRGIDTMAVVANKKSDLDRVQRALAILQCERSVSLQFDKIKNDEVRSLVYGLIESLHFTLSELTKEGNKVKECFEIFTQTEEEPSTTSLEFPLSSNDCSHTTHNHSQEISELTNERNQVKESVEMLTHKADEELSQPSPDLLSSNNADQSQDEPPPIIPNLFELPKDEPFDESSIKIENLWEDAMEMKDEEMFSDDVETYNDNGDIAGDRGYIATIVDNNDSAQSEALINMGGDFENEDVDETMNYSNDNENREKDGEEISSGTVELEKKRRSSRNVSRPVILAESLDYSDEDYEPTIKKKSKGSTLKMKIRKSSDTIEKKSGSLSSKAKSREMKCTECEYQTTSANSFIHHLRRKHSTNLALAGLALRCDCGVESVSNGHIYKCDVANFTVIRKRDGPIQAFNDEKTTPQCILCEVYPKTAIGYIVHLDRHHKSSPIANGIWLLCKCGVKYRHNTPDSDHTKECTRRVFTLHKVADN